MSLRPAKLEYERTGVCRCGLPSDSSEHNLDGGNHVFEEETIEYVTLRGERIRTAFYRDLFEGATNYAVIESKDETLANVNKLLEIALSIGWAFVSATSDFITVDGVVSPTMVLFFKWIGD